MSFQGDLERMGAQRRERLVTAFGDQDAAALVILGQANVAYATGARVLQTDAAGTALERAAAVLLPGESVPHLFTPWPEGAPGYPSDHLHEALSPHTDAGASGLVATLAMLLEDDILKSQLRILIDEIPGTLFNALRPLFEDSRVGSAGRLLTGVRLLKTEDEVACIAYAQEVTEAAMGVVYPLVTPGRDVRELSSTLLSEALSHGVEACVVDPIWQTMPASTVDGPPTFSGCPSFPLVTTGGSVLHRGDVVWNDTGFSFGGYHSDFGRTWVVGDQPTAAQRQQFHRWRDVVQAASAQLRAGATAHDVAAAATAVEGGTQPWLAHLYVAHGMGMNSAEPPLIGTDLGEAVDKTVELEPGMVVVLEPVIWDDGLGGYRGEEVFVVQPFGPPRHLSSFHYEPFA